MLNGDFSPKRRPARRSAVTLMEILVVLAIIGILAGLTFVLSTSSKKAAVDMQVQIARAKAKKSTLPKKSPPLAWKENEYIVVFKPGTKNSKSQAQRLAQLCQGAVIHDYDGPFLGCALMIAPGTLDLLNADAIVAVVQNNIIRHTCVQAIPTGIRRIYTGVSAGGTPLISPIQNGQLGGSNLVGDIYPAVAVVDSGIDATHPDLNVVFNKGFNEPDFGDQVGHGTHVAGIIGAKNNSIGVVGVAPGAPLWNIRVLDATGAGPDSDIIASLQFLAANADKVKVINMSLGGPGIDVALNMAVDFCTSQGQVVCVSAGNDAADTITYCPATAATAICVTALADSDGAPGGVGPVTSSGPDDTFANFSNWGTPVAVIAPGVDILSTLPVAGTSLGANYGVLSGTSMASPHVAGLVARMLSVPSPKIRNAQPNVVFPSIPAAQIRQMLLQNSTQNIPGIFDALNYPLISAKGY